MLQNTDKVRVENRGRAIVAYRVPETRVVRRFEPHEVKELEMGELRAAVQVAGAYRVIMNNLIIHSKEAVEELLPNAEPEYFYTVADVDFLLTRGTLDQLRDALDFAPRGVVELIKDQAVKTKLNDVSKRETILNQTNFDVTKAIEINQLSEVDATPRSKTRRVISTTEESAVRQEIAPARRVATPKYTIVK